MPGSTVLVLRQPQGAPPRCEVYPGWERLAAALGPAGPLRQEWPAAALPERAPEQAQRLARLAGRVVELRDTPGPSRWVGPHEAPPLSEVVTAWAEAAGERLVVMEGPYDVAHFIRDGRCRTTVLAVEAVREAAEELGWIAPDETFEP